MKVQTGRETVGTSAVEIAIGVVPPTGAKLVASAANAGAVYIGNSSSVTADSADATDGFPLLPGESIVLPHSAFKDATSIYAIGTAAGEKVWWIAY